MDTIELGNAYELIKKIPDKSVDLIVTDPPYEIGKIRRTGILKKAKKAGKYVDDLNDKEGNFLKGIDLKILDEFTRVMKKINIYLWCNKEQIYDYMTYFVKERGCNFEIIIWAKDNPLPLTCGHYLKDKEYCLYFWERGVKVQATYETGKTVYVTGVNQADRKKYRHPTIKPEKIIENLIKNSSERGGLC